MNLPKTLGEVLLRLYGPNGSDATVHRTQAREMALYRELERHGLVEVTEREGLMRGMFDVRRTFPGAQTKQAIKLESPAYERPAPKVEFVVRSIDAEGNAVYDEHFMREGPAREEAQQRFDEGVEPAVVVEKITTEIDGVRTHKVIETWGADSILWAGGWLNAEKE